MQGKKLTVGVIAAAGKGTRAYPRTTFIPKPLFMIEEATLLERNIAIQHSMGIKTLYVIVGHLKEMVLAELDRLRGKFHDMDIIPALWTQKGLASDIASLRDRIQEDFLLILGDEFYYRTDHKKILSFRKRYKKSLAIIATVESSLISDIRKNYSVELDKERVVSLIEKPQDPPNRILGLGTYLFSSDYFDFFSKTPESSRSGVVELTDVIDLMAKEKEGVYACNLGGSYFNINSLADLYTATYRIRSDRFKNYRITSIIPAYNNEATIPDVLMDFKNVSHEMLVVDMGSNDRTAKIATSMGVKVKSPPATAAFASHRINSAEYIFDTMHHASGDILVLVPADGSFRSKDLPKLLEYLKDSDMVVGTRTTRQLIEQGSLLKPAIRWINVFLGKLVEVMWWSQEPRFTDVACAYRAIWKESFEKISPDLTSKDKSYLVEMMVEIMRYHMRCIEIPVSFFKRYGQTPEESGADRWSFFFSILKMILVKRFFK